MVVLDVERGCCCPALLLFCLGDVLEVRLFDGSRREVVLFGNFDVELLIMLGFLSPFFTLEPFAVLLLFSLRRSVSGVDNSELDGMDARLVSGCCESTLLIIFGPVPLRGVSGGVIE